MESYKLILNDITAAESLPLFDKHFEDYKKIAFLFLNRKGKHLFAEDILNCYREDMNIERVFDQQHDRFIQGCNHKKDGKLQSTWHDSWSLEEIEKEDDFFNFFFACKLRHLNLQQINDFLSFHADYSFKNNRQEYLQFLRLTLLEYCWLLNSNSIEVLKEWVRINENVYREDKTEIEDKIKGRIPREPGDRLTALNLNQTALFIQLMQQANIILKGDNLTYTQAGKALHLLTGYSAHTLRQQLGTKGEIEGVKFEDYKELYQTILKMADLVKTKLYKK
jgi:hypothetical protein